MDGACQSCRYCGCESALGTQGPPQDIECHGLCMAGKEAHKWQEGKHTSTVGGLRVDVLVAQLLWGSWRHLAREPLGDTAVLSRRRYLGGWGKVLGLSLEAHASGWCLGFYFPKDSLSVLSPCAPLCSLRHCSSPRGFDRHGQSSLIYATLLDCNTWRSPPYLPCQSCSLSPKSTETVPACACLSQLAEQLRLCVASAVPCNALSFPT